VLSPTFEIGSRRAGVDSVFLEDAEAYYAKYQSFDYWRTLIRNVAELARLGDVRLIAEFGCGFGNSTLPLLELFPQARVVASDISPNLLAILNRLLVARGLRERCVPVAVDALKPFMRPGSADLVIGSAILHHLTDPDAFLRMAMAALRPGGVAIFFEPLEGGYAVLRLICEDIAREAKRRGESNAAIKMLDRIARSLEPQIFRKTMPGWQSYNDKWAFPRSVLDALARSAGAHLTINPLHDNVRPFRRQITYMVDTYTKARAADMPPWAWEIIDRFDTGTFSPEMLTDLAFEGSLIFRKAPAGGTQAVPADR
jgi:SAM-dependent methyltransferase